MESGRSEPLVLVVDDDPVMRLLIGESLRSAGFTIEEAEDGLLALDAFARLAPDMVLLDVNMPQIDGFAVCAAMREMTTGDGTPVVMVTGLDDVDSINRAYEVGATDFITKPINWGVLSHRVRYILRASQAFDELRRNKDSLTEAQRIACLGNWEWNIQGNRFRWSGEVYESLGMRGQGSNETYEAFVDFAHPEDRDGIRTAFERAVAGERQLDIEHRIIGFDGRVRFVHQRGEVSFDHHGAPLRMTGTTQDIDERVQAEEKLRLAANAMENVAEAVMISDAAGRIVSVNRAFTTMTGYASDEVLGRTSEFLRSDQNDPACYADVWEMINKTGHWQGELCGKRSNGDTFPQGISISEVKDKSGRSSHYVSVSSDISRYKQYEARLAFLAHHDPLTVLPNRFSLQAHLQDALMRARRDENVLALMFIDLDDFKLVNDSLGHVMGDRLLKAAAQRLGGCVRQTDLLARLGGDEFVVVLEGVKSTNELTKIADKLLEVLAAPFVFGSQELSIAGSIGVSCYPQDGAESDVLLKNADSAMYRAKELGGNVYQFFSPEMDSEAIEEVVTVANLRHALAHSQFLLHYQPRIELASGRITGIEALIRWRHPEHGLISPDSFIPLAEETGLIAAIGEWVLRTACKQARAWQAAGLPALRLAVNLSPRQFRQSYFAQQVTSILTETGLDSGLLELEITETLLMQDLEKTKAILSQLKSLGVSIAIDDFGTGYSSLAYLKRFPVDYLKIDRSFVSELPDNADDVAIIKAIMALAKSLKLRVIAEGVETRTQQAFLETHGCDEAQGYLISRPLPAAEMEAVLGANLNAPRKARVSLVA